jgi:hypothetical protein
MMALYSRGVGLSHVRAFEKSETLRLAWALGKLEWEVSGLEHPVRSYSTGIRGKREMAIRSGEILTCVNLMCWSFVWLFRPTWGLLVFALKLMC